MPPYRIAVLPGDGIGPEVTSPTLSAVQAAAERHGVRMSFTPHDAGAEHYRRHGEALPRAVLDDCLAADAVFLAAIGLPDVRLPDGTEVQPVMMVGLRRAMELHTAVRPIKLYAGVPSPLRDVGAGIDFVIVRENLEGLFASFGGGAVVGDTAVTDTLVVTREGTTKVCESAFRIAAKRSGRPRDGRRIVTCVDKANVFRSFAFFRRVYYDVAARHPGIAAEATYVDAASLYMVQAPDAFDVIVTENQFGDILSDLGAGLVGGLGLAPSAEIGDRHALFQPSHGTAPTIAGKDIANPLAAILSGAMMLDWLGETRNDPAAVAAGRCLEGAVAKLLASGRVRTPDLGGTSGTKAVGEAVVRAIEEDAP
jgi:3-isopropylmalate dehydrogenase